MMIQRLMATLFVVLAFGAFGVACTGDFETGAQLPGQECTVDDHCVGDAVCVERRCRAVSGSRTSADVGGDADDDVAVDNHHHNPDVGTDTGPGQPDVIDTNDPQPGCDPDVPNCFNEFEVYDCVIGEGGEPVEIITPCGDGERCVDGQCVQQPLNDEPGPDPCCVGGCGAGEICHECQCVDYDIQTCQYQDQPCEVEGQISGGYVCAALGVGSTNLRCIGVCSPNAANPDQTCPQSGSVCAFSEPGEPNGWCLSACQVGDGCADTGMTCIYNGSSTQDGFCLPVSGPGQPGDSCDPQDPYSCADESLCIDGICRQSCRPFDQPQTDCPSGEYCLAMDDNLGICLTDTSTDSGCTQEFTTCGADATGCFPGGFAGTPTCYQFCRLELGNQDCTTGSCIQHDPESDVLGMCF